MEVKELVKALRCWGGITTPCKSPFGDCAYIDKGWPVHCCESVCNDSADLLESMQEELDRVKAERDVAVEDLQIHGGCGICKHGYYEPVMGGICCDTKPKNGWISNKNGQKINRCIIFEWRGLEGRTSHE